MEQSVFRTKGQSADTQEATAEIGATLVEMSGGSPAPDFRANAGFAQAHHIGNVAAVVPLRHRQAGGHGVLPEVGQLHRRRRRRAGVIAQSVAIEFAEDFQAHQIGVGHSRRPAGPEPFHHPVADGFTLRPEAFKPAADFGDIAAVGDGVVQLGVAGEAGGGEAGAPIIAVPGALGMPVYPI